MLASEQSEASGTFLAWFHAHGTVHEDCLDIQDFPDQGRGAISKKDLPEGFTLFTIPRSLTLSLRTSTLPNLFGAKPWKKLGLNQGWAGLILCMMWEESIGSASKWSSYLESLPTSFDTPMFWEQSELEELKGTYVVDKIGREEAEQDYRTKVVPAIQSRPDLFPREKSQSHFSLLRYHINGSRILSRSFHVEEWDEGGNDEEDESENEETGEENASMDVDRSSSSMQVEEEQGNEEGDEDEEDEEEEDSEDPRDVAMVPMADMLNARYGSENCKLFYEERDLKMVSTKEIKKGEQIWNTYGDPPNSDLLRRYGHVDLIPLPDGRQGNPADVVEIRADVVVSVLEHVLKSSQSQERIDWWLEEGGDDVFILDNSLDLPEAMTSLIRLLSFSIDEWTKVRDKGKPPKPKVDGQVLQYAIEALGKRRSLYPTSIEEDDALLASGAQLTRNKMYAIIVRRGEKLVLEAADKRWKQLLQEYTNKGTKRKVSDSKGPEANRSKNQRRK